MNKRYGGPEHRLVWRFSESALQGEWVEPGTTDRDISTAAKEVASGSSWASSSFDLLHGVEVTEDNPDTIPGELYDELFDAGAGGREPKAPSKR